METTTHCAYNITRNTLISQRVTSVSNLPDLAGLLALVLNGPGRDSNSAVFLSQINGAIEIPRFFAFDIAYLDDDQRIIESTGVGPGTPFPPLTQGVASVLFLSDQCLAKSATTPGDLVTICTGPELAALLKAVSQPPPPEILLQTDPSPWTNPELRQSREPFDGSLIYLPASGPPQKTEFFLPIQALPPRMPDLSNEHPTESAPSELPGVEIPITRESAPIAPFQQPDEPATEQPAEPELPRFHEPAPVRFFHPAASIQAQPPRQSEAPAEADQPRVPRAPQLHTLEAVVRQIDAQLRRETKAHEPVPEEHFSVEQFTPPLPTQEPPELQLEIADEKVQAPFLAQVSDASEPVHSPPPLPAPVQDDFASASAERSEKAADILRSRSKEKLSFTSRV
ncbi:MAG: hypothetical protein ACXU95_16410, partial [Isosphaeraceae bacterium]